MSPINSKEKGSEFERRIARILSKWWGEEFHRTPGSGGLHWKKDNRVAGDIVAPMGSNFPFSIENKKWEDWEIIQLLKGTGDIENWWKQCEGDAIRVSKEPLLIFTKNYAPIYMMMLLSTFRLMCPNILFNIFIVYNAKNNYRPRVVCLLNDFISKVSKEDVLGAGIIRKSVQLGN